MSKMKQKHKLTYTVISILSALPNVTIASDLLKKTNEDSYSIGETAKANGAQSFSAGNNTDSDQYGIAVGFKARAKGTGSIAIGSDSKAEHHNSVALGRYSEVKTPYSTAVGSYSLADREYDDNMKKNLKNKIKESMPDKLIDPIITEFSVGGSSHASDSVIEDKKYSQITHVAPGTENTDAVNLYQMNKAIDTKLDNRIGKVDDLKKKTTQVEEYNTRAKRSADDTEKLQTQTAQHEQAALTAKTNTEKHENNAQTALKETVKHRDKANVLVREIQNEASNIVSKISQDVDTGVIHVGKSLDGNTVSVAGTQGDRVITGVAQGARSNDAANIAQLNRVNNTATTAHATAQKNTSRINNLEHQLSKTNTKIDRGLAASAALTGLFQPYGIGKANVTAGLGGYGSSQAIAVGTGYRITENTAVKAGLAYSGGNNLMYNASFNLEW